MIKKLKPLIQKMRIFAEKSEFPAKTQNFHYENMELASNHKR